MSLHAQGADARPSSDSRLEGPSTFVTARDLTIRSAHADRADTTFLFAVSGPGSYGSPGTDERGFTFDDGSESADAGWFGVDLAAQEGEFWHVAATAVCAGSATDMCGVLPFTPGDTVNDFALWCGLTENCRFDNLPGYGNDWDQWLRIASEDFVDEMTISFVYSSFFEGGEHDVFQVLLEETIGEEIELVEYHRDDTSGPQSARDFTLNIEAVSGVEYGDIVLRFSSDSAGSDEDGGCVSDVGAVWVDNLRIERDGSTVLEEDFESGLTVEGIEADQAPSAGDFSTLYCNLFHEDICVANFSFAWAFFDLTQFNPEYAIPVTTFGPPYLDCAVQSPILEVGDDGEPFALDPGTRLEVSYWMYEDNPLEYLIIPTIGIAARTAGGCLQRFVEPEALFMPDRSKRWEYPVIDLTSELLVSAGAAEPTGLALYLGVRDMYELWHGVYGDGDHHTPAPFFDNVRVCLIRDWSPRWSINDALLFQDDFPDDQGDVRTDVALDVAPPTSPLIQPGDSCVVKVELATWGGIATGFNSSAGEERPELYLYWRVVAGPSQGTSVWEQADQDDIDGIWSPCTGLHEFGDDIWGGMQADHAAVDGVDVLDAYAFDFCDSYFAPGDVIQYFFQVETGDGSFFIYPETATSAYGDYKRFLTMRCLPTPGCSMLFVEDAEDGFFLWNQALRHCGYEDWDAFTTRAPAHGHDNGLGSRATPADLAQYNCIIWDSGDQQQFTVTDDPQAHKALDSDLLTAWLNDSEHDVYLWLLGDGVGHDLGMGNSFLNEVLGLELAHGSLYYSAYTGILVPTIYAVHPALEFLGGHPYFWAGDGCPAPNRFSPVTLLGPLVEITHEWEVDIGGFLVAGALNRDPDGDGGLTNASGHANGAMYNPFAYATLRDRHYAAGTDLYYIRVMLRHVLNNLLAQMPDGPMIDVDEEAAPPAVTTLRGAWPNPFNPSTTIAFSLAEGGQASLRIFDVSGRLVRELQNGRLPAGEYEFSWDGRDGSGARQSSGVYFVALKKGNIEEKCKLVLLQ